MLATHNGSSQHDFSTHSDQSGLFSDDSAELDQKLACNAQTEYITTTVNEIQEILQS